MNKPNENKHEVTENNVVVTKVEWWREDKWVKGVSCMVMHGN